MRWEEVSAQAPRIIGASGHGEYHASGYLAFPGLIPESELGPLRAALGMIVEESRALSASTHLLDLEVGHTADAPRLRRAACIDDAVAVFWDFCRESVLVDIAADVLGPHVRFRDAFANLKWANGGAPVAWHQDLAFYPHTNTGTIQFIVTLDAVTDEQGPLTVIPGSHRGPIYSHYAADGSWVGAIDEAAIPAADRAAAVELVGPPGSVSVHHGLLVHSSKPNLSDTGRPALVVTYTAADAIPYTAPPYRSSHYGTLVAGVEPGVAHHEEMTLVLPPDWTHGYTSIFSHQDATRPESETP